MIFLPSVFLHAAMALVSVQAMAGEPRVTSALQVLERHAPEFPRRAAIAGLEGWVKLEFVVNEHGQATSFQVLESHPADIFVESAIQALEKWRFKPQEVDGNPVSQRVSLRIDFTLKEGEP